MNPMIKNIFLTGGLHVGKSTIIRNVLQKLRLNSVSGFRTEVIFENGEKRGFRLVSFSGEEKIFAHVDFPEGERFDVYQVNLQVFETFGVEILTHALDRSQLIVMDELGSMEKKAKNFQKAVAACLDSEIPVLGVFQKRADWIENKLRPRHDTIIFQIDQLNREISQEKVFQIVEKLLKQK